MLLSQTMFVILIAGCRMANNVKYSTNDRRRFFAAFSFCVGAYVSHSLDILSSIKTKCDWVDDESVVSHPLCFLSWNRSASWVTWDTP